MTPLFNHSSVGLLPSSDVIVRDMTYARPVQAIQENISAVLAHQGGWDELLLIAVPIAVVIGLLAIVKRRVERAAIAANAAPESSISSNSGTDTSQPSD
ncbi:MAG: hypothetical protein O3A61_00585 [Actinomycetota bacterium]|jgi:hypothetical protein|nr:hypothetical protein [Actinomycetota bacterium]